MTVINLHDQNRSFQPADSQRGLFSPSAFAYAFYWLFSIFESSSLSAWTCHSPFRPKYHYGNHSRIHRGNIAKASNFACALPADTKFSIPMYLKSFGLWVLGSRVAHTIYPFHALELSSYGSRGLGSVSILSFRPSFITAIISSWLLLHTSIALLELDNTLSQQSIQHTRLKKELASFVLLLYPTKMMPAGI